MAQNTKVIEYSEQNILNRSYDRDLGLLLFLAWGYNGQSAQVALADSMAVKSTEVGNTTYFAFAAPGTAQSTNKWQAFKIDDTDGMVLTWADADSEFDNIATDLTALSYS